MKRSDAHRLRRRWPWVLAVILVAALVLADRSGLLLARSSDDLSSYHGRAVAVLRVISPHTLEIDRPDVLRQRSVTRVRLWGVTAPLPAGPDREPEPRSAEAMAMTRDLVDGRRIILQLESTQTRDQLGRVLAHVELEDGGTLNEALVEAGLTIVDERIPHSRLIRYARAERAARRARLGVWSD